ncbi:aldehyde dehydrogenase family protein [Thermoplasma sp.]|uniref:aldehyde dehydrogenase family protein n=1 Tax=Thermoplasma sp. TaxID=1973142 RepID=UPI001288C6CE|nr:aldehyde dehydrogenase family protein [Thermoplasma sp.]KAA8922599.1 MAG: aldehyde dehydrogenase [Thermoplasma sp.]
MIIRNRFTDEIEDAYLEYGSPGPELDAIQDASASLRSLSVEQIRSSIDSVFDYLQENRDAILPRIARTTGKPVGYLISELNRSLSDVRKIGILEDPVFNHLPQYSIVYPNHQDPVSSMLVPSLFFLSNRVPVAVVPDRHAFLVPSLMYKAFASSGLPKGSLTVWNHGIPDGLPGSKYVVSYSTDGMQDYGRTSGTILADRGGPSVVVVWKDADLDFAAQDLVSGIIERHGTFLRAMIVHEDVFEYFVNRLKELLPSIRAGDPEDLSTQLGPCASDIDLVRSLNMIAEARKARSLMYSKGPQGNIITPTLINGEITDFDDMLYTPVYILHHAASVEEVMERIMKIDPVSLAVYSSDSMIFRMMLTRARTRYIGLNRYPEISYRPDIVFPKRGIFL